MLVSSRDHRRLDEPDLDHDQELRQEKDRAVNDQQTLGHDIARFAHWARQKAVTECIHQVTELGLTREGLLTRTPAASPERWTRQLAVRNCGLARRRHLQQEGALLHDQPGRVQVLPA
jgi:hypothetical protein